MLSTVSRPKRFHVEHQDLRIAFLAEPASATTVQAGDTYIRTRERPAAVTAAKAASPTRSAAVAVPSNLAVSHASHATAAACNTWTASSRRCRHRRLSGPGFGDWTRLPGRKRCGQSQGHPRAAILAISSWRLNVLRYLALIVMAYAALPAVSFCHTGQTP